MTTKRDLSAITPSGSLTLGNYLGALRRFAERQHATQGFYFVADLHALTTAHDPAHHRQLTRSTAALFLASGLDPDTSTVFVQSGVGAHVQLAYLLECTAHVGELSRMIQFKEKGSRPGTRASLFTYPCLMAADILLYEAESVPVGGDQSQHVELTRDLASRFNQSYGTVFTVPRLEPAVLSARVLDLHDPSKKMSKSDPEDAAGVIRMLDGPDLIASKIRRAVTDSEGVVRHHPDEKPGVSNLLEIIAVLTNRAPDEVAAELSTYGALKTAATDVVIDALSPIRQRHDEIMGDAHHLDEVLGDGAERAASVADPVLARARAAMGL